MKGEREDVKEIEGVQALFVVNLEPRELMGELSEGMLFDIGYGSGGYPSLGPGNIAAFHQMFEKDLIIVIMATALEGSMMNSDEQLLGNDEVIVALAPVRHPKGQRSLA